MSASCRLRDRLVVVLHIHTILVHSLAQPWHLFRQAVLLDGTGRVKVLLEYLLVAEEEEAVVDLVQFQVLLCFPQALLLEELSEGYLFCDSFAAVPFIFPLDGTLSRVKFESASVLY